MPRALTSSFDAIAVRLSTLSPRRRREATAVSAPAIEPTTPAPSPAAIDRDLIQQRDRLIEKFTIMQADLGGAFYEMAIRDHVRLDALTAKAAELQVVDTELGQVERAIELQRTGAVGNCARCNAPYGPGVTFCSQCGHGLIRFEEATTNGATA